MAIKKHSWKNPTRSRVTKGTEGKFITFMGSNSTGKTYQATQPDSNGKEAYVFSYEDGLNALDGVAYLPIEKWYDGIKELRDIKKNIEEFKETFSAIVIDEVYTASILCQNYISAQKGVATIKEGNGGFGLWQEYALEFWDFVMTLKKLGITIICIIHTQAKVIGQDENGNDIVKQLPKGDWRSVTPVIDNSDLVLYLEANGVDEHGKVIKSSAYSAETNRWFARSRFEYFPTYIQEFTKENLEQALTKAIELEAQAKGSSPISQEEKQELTSMPKQDFRQTVNKAIALGRQLCLIYGENPSTVAEQKAELDHVVASVFGNGATINDVGNLEIDKVDMVEELIYRIQGKIDIANRTIDLHNDTNKFKEQFIANNPEATQEEINEAVNGYIEDAKSSWQADEEEKQALVNSINKANPNK